ncbi:NmrA family NAD(P)-binding protein [Pararoseomonas indoligenes]|uniref:NmrA family NAD(P)-binding protein n=1 Tax=Roseomonas indoligenes TaxID=2820811 RepID=A0A940N2X2_9PROT|nr:NmrA family NAD(P)-binding protein [Pararoseomonas indoligenes]MBP0495765.1 NmrA family NAD(P)-binding protein [Pararoseomonas indoligenes]
MIIVLGATGHVGSTVARTLIEAGESVMVVTRSEDKAASWRQQGAEAAPIDVGDADRLRDVLRRGRRAFLLNPPAAPSTDTDREERRTAASIVAALDGSGLEGVVAASTYCARPGEEVGDLGVLFEFEQALAAQTIPAVIQRGAYYMSNWDALLDAARGGTLPSLFPAELRLPMVSPDDLGRAAARRLLEPPGGTGIRHVEGPERYSPQDVADAFAAALGRPVAVAVTPREGWIGSFRALGFSEAAARSYAGMTAVSVDGACDLPGAPERGAVALATYITELVSRLGTPGT